MCDQCKEPHTQDAPLANVAIQGAPRVSFNVHVACIPALEATLVDGTELVVRTIGYVPVTEQRAGIENAPADNVVTDSAA